MGVSQSNIIALPRKNAGSFFHWKVQGEPAAIYFHLNVVDLLQRDISPLPETGVAGVLLGRIVHGRKLTLIVEDYQPIPNAPSADTGDSARGARHLLREIIETWHSRMEKRISVLGFYRSCLPGQASLNADDLEVSNVCPSESERIVLLLEPQKNGGLSGNLHLVSNGTVVWEWPSVRLNRKELAEDVTPDQSPIVTSQPPPRSELAVRNSPEAGVQSRKRFAVSRELRWGLGIGVSVIMVAAGFASSRGSGLFQGRSSTSKSPGEPASLGLKLERVGSDWKVSWDRTAPFFPKAAKGHLSIRDGFIHKSLDLDVRELQSGSIMYTPATDDVTLNLEIVSPESVMLASDTARMVAGLLPPPSGPNYPVGGPSESRVRPGKRNSLDSASTSSEGNRSASDTSGKSQTSVSSASDFAKIPLTMKPPDIAIGRKVNDLEVAVPVPKSDGTPQSIHILAPPPPGQPGEANANVTNPDTPHSTGSVSLAAAARPTEKVTPAQLLKRKDPVYPEFAKRSGITGTVELQFRVSSSGLIEDLKVVKGPAVLAQAAVESVNGWQYSPAQVNGVPAESNETVNIVFKLN